MMPHLHRQRGAGISLGQAAILFATVLGPPVLAGTAPAHPPEHAALPATSCTIELGVGASLNGARVFPEDNAWNQEIATAPVDPNSQRIIARLGPEAGLHPDFGSGLYEGAKIGIPYVVVAEDQPPVPVLINQYWLQSDPGRYPVPPYAPIENLGTTAEYSDAHVIVVQRDPTRPDCLGLLYEMFRAEPVGDYPHGVEHWKAAASAAFDLSSNDQRPAGWTSADAAGLPIFPGLVRYDEVARAIEDRNAGGEGVITHALRFTLAPGYTRAAYVAPARHAASSNTDPELAPFGMRVRLKAEVAISDSWPPEVQVILRTLKKYGMIVADNGGNWFISGAPDGRWSNGSLAFLGYVHGHDFEVVRMDRIVEP